MIIDPTNSAGRIILPAETWMDMAGAYSADRLALSEGKRPVAVKTCPFREHLYTVFGVVYGCWGSDIGYVLEAWRLLPESMYEGETTTIWIDEEAIRSGAKERGDHTGLIVTAGGRRMVCVEPAAFGMGLPTFTLSLADAMAYDDQCRKAGWRSLLYPCAERQWALLEGHPVVRYVNSAGNCRAALLWRYRRRIEEITLDNGVPLEPACLDCPQGTEPVQMGLF